MVKTKDKIKKSSNAVASAFGWTFQSNAGIVIMLRNLDRADSVRIEGDEDIEVRLEDGTKVYAQAKGAVKPYDSTNAIVKLSGALRTLSAVAVSSDVDSLIYVTNLANPFDDEASSRAFRGEIAEVAYKDLPPQCQEQIKQICMEKDYGLPVQKFSVLTFDFSGEGENRYRIIRQLINELLSDLGLSDKGWGKRVLERWRVEFWENASQPRRDVVITKKKMIWPIVVWECENRKSLVKIDGFDPDEIEDVLRRCRATISDKEDNFQFAARVFGDFIQFQEDHPSFKFREQINGFIAERWKDYEEEFDFNLTDRRSMQVAVAVALERIIVNNDFMESIKRKVHICD